MSKRKLPEILETHVRELESGSWEPPADIDTTALTPRQIEAVRLRVDGYTIDKIAKHMGADRQTIRTWFQKQEVLAVQTLWARRVLSGAIPAAVQHIVGAVERTPGERMTAADRWVLEMTGVVGKGASVVPSPRPVVVPLVSDKGRGLDAYDRQKMDESEGESA